MGGEFVWILLVVAAAFMCCDWSPRCDHCGQPGGKSRSSGAMLCDVCQRARRDRIYRSVRRRGGG